LCLVPTDINRRKFLRLAAGSAVVLAVGGAAYYYANKNQAVSATQTKNQAVLATQTIGDTSSHAVFPFSEIQWYPIVAEASGTVTAITLNLFAADAGSHIQCGIYSDNAGTPGNLLSHSNSVTVGATSQNYTCPLISSVPIVQGTQYWIAFENDDVWNFEQNTGLVVYYKNAGKYAGLAVVPFNWPATGAGYTFGGPPPPYYTANMGIIYIPSGAVETGTSSKIVDIGQNQRIWR